MSEASTDHADRPAEVTDPLLWGLATAVADAHQADEDGACVSPSCVGAAWPCAAWNNAQEGMRAAQAATRPASAATTGTVDRDPATAETVRSAASHHTQPAPAAGRDGAAVASAA
ncbi:hypothetical protein [Micromonospora inositola]|uniref:Uncharacterized protein n=1 Tax=Micromonospora inositola TaxID=47865 RepID=A0A1C5JFK6_9ACTN|nr:hypothetical protein [Micromonospora inositola]SCG69283.1 hypothetical protein GA0070613_4579 [Micromonospora inositola]